MTVGEFIEQEVAEIRRRFCRAMEAQLWGWQLSQIKGAVLAVHEDMERRGMPLSLEKQHCILQECWRTVEQHGALPEVRRMGLYLRKVVQDHMLHRGPGYYEQAKEARYRTPLRLAPAEVEKWRAGIRKAEGDAVALQEVCRAVHAGKAIGRKKRRGDSAGAGIQIDLFGAPNVPESMAERPNQAKSSQTGARDSDLP